MATHKVKAQQIGAYSKLFSAYYHTLNTACSTDTFEVLMGAVKELVRDMDTDTLCIASELYAAFTLERAADNHW